MNAIDEYDASRLTNIKSEETNLRKHHVSESWSKWVLSSQRQILSGSNVAAILYSEDSEMRLTRGHVVLDRV